MNELLENKGIQKFRENECWSYLLEDEDRFSKSGYKSAQLQMKDCMLKCATIRFNGSLKFIYFTEGLISLPDLLNTMQSSGMWSVFSKIVECVMKVKNYGYLSCENIDISPECIYANPKTYEPYLVYVPLLVDKSQIGQMNFETMLKSSLMNALRSSNNSVLMAQENKLLEILNYSGSSLDDIYQSLIGMTGMSVHRDDPQRVSSKLVVMSVDKKTSINYTMQKDKITIGRRKDNDIVLDFTNQISRVHCSITKKDERYYVLDEESKHGTYVNIKPCFAGEMMELHDGDILKLPGIQLIVKILAK